MPPTKFIIFYIYFSICFANVWTFIDPITAFTGAAIGFGLWNYDTVKEYTICKYQECCIPKEIKNDIWELENVMSRKLFGQHIVQNTVIPALKAHLQRRTFKALVLSFHGTPGTGKNYVADMIARSLYTRGLKSKFVYKFMGRADFPRSDYVDNYIEVVKDTVHNAVIRCPQSLFIFDEVDKMPKGIFDALTSVLNYNNFKDGDLRQAIFIFLSNIAGVKISEHLGKLMVTDNKLREDTQLSDFENILQLTAYNVDGGFQSSRLIETQVIDHFIPFLPLEKTHLYQCVKEYLRDWGHRNTPNENISDIINSVVTYDPIYGIFAKSGCKKLSTKVAVFVHREKQEY